MKMGEGIVNNGIWTMKMGERMMRKGEEMMEDGRRNYEE
jgi:hypothetical protein